MKKWELYLGSTIIIIITITMTADFNYLDCRSGIWSDLDLEVVNIIFNKNMCL